MMIGSYDIRLVVLSFTVAAIASYVALNLASRVSASQGRAATYWLLGGAVAMGSGIWSMHFIGMLAFRLPIAMSYDMPVTLLSMLAAILASGFALVTINREFLSMRRLVVSGALMGAGIAAMHYIGMGAMQIFPAIDYNPWRCAASIAIAVAASIVALWIAFHLRSEHIVDVASKRLASALVMGIAIVGMHYTGMWAAHFAEGSICVGNPNQISQSWLAATIAGCSLAFLTVTMLIVVFDSRLASSTAQLADSLRRANERLKAEIDERQRGEATLHRASSYLEQILNAIPTPIVVKDRQHRFVFVNESASTMIGRDRTEMVGKTDHDFVPKEQADLFCAQDDLVLSTRKESINEEVITTDAGQQRTLLTRKAVFQDSAGDDVIVALITDITEQKRAAAAVEQSRRFLDSLINALPQPILVKDAQSRWVHVNDAACRRYGLAREEMLGNDDRLVHSPEAAAMRFAEDERVLASGQPLVVEEPAELPGEQGGWILKTRTPITFPDGTRGTVALLADITEQKNTELKLASSQRFLEVMLNAVPNPFFVKDSEHRFVLMNEAFCRMMKHTREDLMGKNDYEVLPAEIARTSYEEDDLVLASEGTVFFERPLLARDGEDLWGLKSKCAILLPDGKRFIVSLITDISALKQIERALRQSNEGLQSINQQLQQTQSQLLQSEKMASIGQLAAGVAHEINNPIGFVYSNLGTLAGYLRDIFSLLGAYEILEESAQPADVERLRQMKDSIDLAFLRTDILDLMKESHDGITRVKNIVQNLKDFSHQGRDEQWQWSRLQDGLESTLTIVNNEIKYKARVVKEYADLPEIQCLPSQLNQVFMNLLVNAAHAIEQTGTITLRTGQDAGEVWVEIADTGCGIAPDNLKCIFDPFFTTKPVGKGTGLGLALSYGIVQKHHGRIDVRSELGKGTTFRIYLPMTQELEAPEAAAAQG